MSKFKPTHKDSSYEDSPEDYIQLRRIRPRYPALPRGHLVRIDTGAWREWAHGGERPFVQLEAVVFCSAQFAQNPKGYVISFWDTDMPGEPATYETWIDQEEDYPEDAVISALILYEKWFLGKIIETRLCSPPAEQYLKISVSVKQWYVLPSLRYYTGKILHV